MGISVIGGAAGGAGGGSVNDFVVDINDTTNNVATLDSPKTAGSYGISLSSADATYDIYAIDSNGQSVGYTNQASLVATAEFTEIVVLGVSNSEIISFKYNGFVSNADSEGDALGAGAYLTNISPSDLPSIDDTATVTGGNFATDVEIYFESGATSTLAKNVTRNSSTELLITRPDVLDPALDPWDVKAVNPGVVAPTGSNSHILSGAIDAGATPAWTTTSPLPQLTLNQAYSATVVATDADGQTVNYTISAGTLPTGLSFDGATGVFSGTPTTAPGTITITASDTAGNENSRDFDFIFQSATGGLVTEVGDFFVHTFSASDDFEILKDIDSLDFLVIAGGGSGGAEDATNQFGGGGGAGGYRNSVTGELSGGSVVAESSLTSLAAGTIAVTVGAGGASVTSGIGNQGGTSSFGTLVSTVGGGAGGRGTNSNTVAGDGGSGGGAGGGQAGATGSTGGNGTAGQGTDGADVGGGSSGGGGGAGSSGFLYSNGGGGLTSSITGTSVGRAGGGAGADGGSASDGGGVPNTDGTDNTGGGGGGESSPNGSGAGGSGIVIVRYAKA